jgi:hypothetical protein
LELDELPMLRHEVEESTVEQAAVAAGSLVP